ncbi:MAG: MaoC family dehydratase [Burkholderiaceae bacterium]
MTAPVVIESLDALEKMVGKEIAVSDWLEITQQRIDAFAAATDDHQWIHVDVEKAKASPLGSTIAHGYLTLSLIAGFSFRTLKVNGVRMGLNYGLNRVRFTSMVPAGSRLRARFVLKAADRIEGGLQLTYDVTIEREGSDKPACIAETVSRVLAA